MAKEFLEREKSKVIGKHFMTGKDVVSGIDNPISLGMRFYILENGEVASEFTPDFCHEGHVGMFHGGLISSVLDESMGRAAMSYGEDEKTVHSVVTGELTVRFLEPIMIGEKKLAVGRAISKEGRKTYCESYIIGSDNRVYAKAKGVFFDVGGIDDVESHKALTGDSNELVSGDPKEL